jgi:hypothetical protein
MTQDGRLRVRRPIASDGRPEASWGFLDAGLALDRRPRANVAIVPLSRANTRLASSARCSTMSGSKFDAMEARRQSIQGSNMRLSP